jgi:hypothetical protein
VKRVKKSKAYYDELIVLEELQTKAVLLMKAKLLIETVVAGEPISKEKLTSEEIKRYISRKPKRFKTNSRKKILIEDEADLQRYIL